MKFLIEDKLVQLIVNYLAVKPFNEVYQMIVELQKLEKAQQTAEKKTPSVEKKTPSDAK